MSIEDDHVRGELTRIGFLRRAAVGAAAVAAAPLLGKGSLEGVAEAASGVKRGGRLVVGFVGGGSAETLDPHGGNTNIDVGRSTVLFEKLFDQRGPKGRLSPVLAESLEPNKTGTVWTVRLRDGVEWHNGKALGADDLLFTFRRILNPTNKLGGAADIGFIDPAKMKKLDRRTVRLFLNQPIADPRPAFASRMVPLIQAGTRNFTRPIGTGPFRFVSWSPGKQSVFRRNPNYWVSNLPYLDELRYVSIPDSLARFNALRSGQVHAIETLPVAQALALRNDRSLRVLSSPTGGMVAMVMDTTKPPFNDVRVRQAFRLLVDRAQMQKNVLAGFGTLGNDLYSPFDELYNARLPQRKYDPERAKALLSAAGASGLSIDIATSTAAQGMLESAQAFAEQAKAAGVTVNVAQGPADTYYSDKYMKVPFFQTQWGNYPLDSMIALSTQSKAPYNEARYTNPAFDKLWSDARSTLDATKRKDKYDALQKMLYNEGGYIIWGFGNYIDGYRANVRGLTPNPARALGYFDFKKVWLS